MDGKKLLLFGILVIAAGAAFVYFDPLELDLLALKQKPAVMKTTPAPHVKASIAVSPTAPSVTEPKAPVTSTQTPTAVAKSPVPATSPVPKAAIVPIQEKKHEVATPATPPKNTAAAPVVVPPVAAAAQSPQPAMKLTEKTKTKPANISERPKNQDLRHCLDLEDDAAIAKCAGE